MHRLNKLNKHAFTLIEMVLAILIIVILASALTYSIARYINKTKTAKAAVDSRVADMRTKNAVMNNKLKSYGF